MIESYIWVYMNDSQWSALIRVTEGHGMYSVEASLGKITLLKKDDGFDLEYPSHSVSLYRDSSIPSTDRYYLHYSHLTKRSTVVLLYTFCSKLFLLVVVREGSV